MALTNEVRLAVPAMPEYLRLARVTAAGLAGRLRFSFDEVEDLRLAIDELCYGLTGNFGHLGTVEIRYVLFDDRLEIEGEARFAFDATPRPTAKLSELSRVILTALVDEHELADRGGTPHFRLVKRRSPGSEIPDVDEIGAADPVSSKDRPVP